MLPSLISHNIFFTNLSLNLGTRVFLDNFKGHNPSIKIFNCQMEVSHLNFKTDEWICINQKVSFYFVMQNLIYIFQ
jgi:hypothetical protein